MPDPQAHQRQRRRAAFIAALSARKHSLQEWLHVLPRPAGSCPAGLLASRPKSAQLAAQILVKLYGIIITGSERLV